jgi:hypothetical protein
LVHLSRDGDSHGSSAESSKRLVAIGSPTAAHHYQCDVRVAAPSSRRQTGSAVQLKSRQARRGIEVQSKSDVSRYRKPRVFAHRGGAGEEAESTASAFRSAIDAGADVLEFDLELTQDDQIVVWHGKGLDNVYIGTRVLSGKSIRKLNWDAPPGAPPSLLLKNAHVFDPRDPEARCADEGRRLLRLADFVTLVAAVEAKQKSPRKAPRKTKSVRGVPASVSLRSAQTTQYSAAPWSHAGSHAGASVSRAPAAPARDRGRPTVGPTRAPSRCEGPAPRSHRPSAGRLHGSDR